MGAVHVEREEAVVSVIVPIFNVAEYLPQCIESICGQTYHKLEIILVDDGSTDGSGRICDEYAEKDRRVMVIHKKNGGLVSARKEGLMAAGGEYISYVDGDDWIDRGMYQKLLEIDGEADLIAFAAYEEYGGEERRGWKKNTVREGLYADEKDKFWLYGHMIVNDNFFENGILAYLWAKLIKRELLMECQMKVSDIITYAEDAACVYPCLLKADSIYVSNAPFYHYRVRPASMVKEEVKAEILYELYRTLGNMFYAHPAKESLKQQLRGFMWQGMLLKNYTGIKSGMPLFPFKRVQAGMKVAVYGAGIFGKVIRECCGQNSSIRAAGWFDRRYDFYAGQGLNIQAVEELYKEKFDVIVIAILNEKLARQICGELVGNGICRDKIDYIHGEDLSERKLPQPMEKILASV